MDVIKGRLEDPRFLRVIPDELTVRRAVGWLDEAQVCPNYLCLGMLFREVDCPDSRACGLSRLVGSLASMLCILLLMALISESYNVEDVLWFFYGGQVQVAIQRQSQYFMLNIYANFDNISLPLSVKGIRGLPGKNSPSRSCSSFFICVSLTSMDQIVR